ncbi:MAG: hypothetical protein ACRCX8_03415 [Sarcina sp.]
MENRLCKLKPFLETYFKDKEHFCLYTKGMHKKVVLKCPDCGFEKEMPIYKVYNRGFSCNRCGDKYSYPNKLMLSILTNLNEDFISEYSPTWARGRFYDFYIEKEDKKYIIEMDGGFHKGCEMRKLTKKEAEQIDLEKDYLAINNNVEVVRIDCDTDSIEEIMKNINESKLKDIIKLEKINWNWCQEKALKNKVKEACDLFNSIENSNATKVAGILKISIPSTIKALNKGTFLGWCNYNPSEIDKQRRIKVRCVETGIVYNCAEECAIDMRLKSVSCVRKCCVKKMSSYNKFHFDYCYEDIECKNIDFKNINKPKSLFKKVLFVEENKIFENASECSKYLNIKSGNITRVCRNERSHYKGYHFEYIEN